MNKIFLESGFLNEEGNKLLAPLKTELDKLFSSTEVKNMSEGDLRILSANLSKLVGDKLSNELLLKKAETKNSQSIKKLKTYQVVWDSGGCAGSEVIGEIQAEDKETAYKHIHEYENGDPYNDDNIFIREKRK